MRTTTYFPTAPADRLNRWLRFVIVGLAVVLPAYAQTKPAGTPPPQEELRPPFAVEPGFRYDPKGRLDPFTSPVPKPAPAAAAPQRGAPGAVATPQGPGAPVLPPEVIIPFSRPRGLKGLMLEDVAVKGVVVAKDPEMTKAIIQGPGNKIYNVARKDELFNAVIKDIRLDAVVFSPVVRRDEKGEALTVKEVRSDSVIYTKLPKNISTEPSTRDVVRKLHPAAGEPK